MIEIHLTRGDQDAQGPIAVVIQEPERPVLAYRGTSSSVGQSNVQSYSQEQLFATTDSKEQQRQESTSVPIEHGHLASEPTGTSMTEESADHVGMYQLRIDF